MKAMTTCPHRALSFLFGISVLLPFCSASAFAATALSIGADYRVRGVAIKERLKTVPDNDYISQRVQGYLITDLSRDVEATLRVQSINPWGVESSSTSLVTRYPDANGDVWIQNAFVRLPNIWRNAAVLTIGRQPIVWGDGEILSDDELGFNAIRAQFTSPWRIEFDVDGFLAKVDEGLQSQGDTDLYGLRVGTDRRLVRWDAVGVWEKSDATRAYEMGASTFPFSATMIDRKIYGLQFRANLRDAFLKGAYYVQDGSVEQADGTETALGGDAYVFGLGGKSNQTRFGRFGAILEMAVGSGDDADSAGEDEAFRPSFAARWDGLERRGYGRYFAATFSDVYSSTAPFAPATSVNDGLPAGTSGIQSIRFGVDATPWAKWTFTFDYYQYKAQKSLAGSKELGTEFDYGVEYRYSGLVTFRAFTSRFSPGEAFDETIQQDASYSAIEADVRF